MTRAKVCKYNYICGLIIHKCLIKDTSLEVCDVC